MFALLIAALAFCAVQGGPIDCGIKYGPYSQCSATCGQGTQTRVGKIVRYAQYGGRACPSAAELIQTRTCSAGVECDPPVDCVVEYVVGECKGNCGQGTQAKWGKIVQEPLNGGRSCSPLEVTDEPCDTGIPCDPVVHCHVEYTVGPCKGNCGQGTLAKWGRIVTEAKNGGRPCPSQRELEVTEACDTGVPCDEQPKYKHF